MYKVVCEQYTQICENKSNASYIGQSSFIWSLIWLKMTH